MFQKQILGKSSVSFNCWQLKHFVTNTGIYSAVGNNCCVVFLFLLQLVDHSLASELSAPLLALL